MKYHFGIIIDFKQYLKTHDPNNVFINSDHEALIRELIRFMMDDDANEVYGGRLEGSDYENLLNHLIEMGILHYHVLFRRNEPYVDLCALLADLCDAFITLFTENGFYDYCRNYDVDKPEVRRLTGDSYAIVTGPVMRRV